MSEFPNDNPDLFQSEFPQEDDDSDIEVVEAFDDEYFADAIIDSTSEPATSADSQTDSWATFLRTLGEVAMQFGAGRDVARGLALTLEPMRSRARGALRSREAKRTLRRAEARCSTSGPPRSSLSSRAARRKRFVASFAAAACARLV